MAITAEMVKELRDKTGAGMMDCKKALSEAGGDMEKAVEVLRKSGVAKAEKKSGRATKEGKIITRITGGKGAMVEVLCETDFVATNEKFINFINGIVERTLELDGDGCVTEKAQAAEQENMVAMIATIGENMQLRRAARWVTNGKLASYLHMGGRIGVMVDVEGETDEAFLNDLCMHIAAFKPDYICPNCIDADVIAKEREIAAAQLTGKPANIIDKIVDGKLNKWYSEVCLLRQPWIKDDKTCLAKLKPNLKVNRFLRWEVGEEL
ncbi:translation elongation factor Ts [Victivallis sp. Marseille-Q1083]|uniref:translation elongation factor Ts n=1 Tax=Victivallis sp. Marseille-Q1083 TaxID=2717288 RepID=UPI00158DB1D7|nr:translation elongation factor Ts [Victivallis sp. Marseille-Q1083]